MVTENRSCPLTISKHIFIYRIQRHLHTSATHIQSVIRMHLIRGRYKAMRSGATRIQSSYRMFKCKKHFLKSIIAVTRIQRNLRVFLNHRRERKVRACVKIQSMWRMYVQVLRLGLYSKAAGLIKKVLYGYMIRQRFSRSVKIQRRSVLLISNAYIACKGRRMTAHMNHCAAKIQALVRGRHLRLLYLHHRVELKAKMMQEKRRHKSASIIQRFVRERKLRSQLEASALTLQRVWRGHQGRLETIKRRKVIRFIQATWRGIHGSY